LTNFANKNVAVAQKSFEIGPRLLLITNTLCLKKGPRHDQLQIEDGLTDYNNFWQKYSRHS